MIDRLSKFIDLLSTYFAHRKGLLPMTGMALVAANFLVGVAASGWLAESDLLLHLGVILAIFGLMLYWAL